METDIEIDLERTVVEPLRCPECGIRLSFRDLVFGHAHTATKQHEVDHVQN